MVETQKNLFEIWQKDFIPFIAKSIEVLKTSSGKSKQLVDKGKEHAKNLKDGRRNLHKQLRLAKQSYNLALKEYKTGDNLNRLKEHMKHARSFVSGVPGDPREDKFRPLIRQKLEEADELLKHLNDEVTRIEKELKETLDIDMRALDHVQKAIDNADANLREFKKIEEIITQINTKLLYITEGASHPLKTMLDTLKDASGLVNKVRDDIRTAYANVSTEYQQIVDLAKISDEKNKLDNQMNKNLAELAKITKQIGDLIKKIDKEFKSSMRPQH